MKKTSDNSNDPEPVPGKIHRQPPLSHNMCDSMMLARSIDAPNVKDEDTQAVSAYPSQ